MRTARVVVLTALAVLALRTPAFSSQAYSVVAGDSLWTIAQHCHASVSALEAANHLTDSSVLQLGETILIPGPKRSAHVTRHGLRPQKHYAAHLRSRTTHSESDYQVARVLWAATHDGATSASLPGVIPWAVAERTLSIEAHITATAMRYLGVPYSWGGTSFAGVDCSGFVWAVFHRNGIDLPRMADEQFAASHHVGGRALRPGDLVFFETYTSGVSHVGIYLGNGRFIHASSSDGVRVDSLSQDYYATRYVGAGRIAR